MIPEGKYYEKKIVHAELRSTEEGKRYVIVKVEINGDTADWFGSFKDTVIQSGSNAGKTVGDVTCETLVAVGWNGDWGRLDDDLRGKPCDVTIEHDEYKGKAKAKVRYLNPIGGGASVDAGDVAELNSKFRATIVAAKKKRPAVEAPASAPARTAAHYHPDDDGRDPF